MAPLIGKKKSEGWNHSTSECKHRRKLPEILGDANAQQLDP